MYRSTSDEIEAEDEEDEEEEMDCAANRGCYKNWIFPLLDRSRS